MTLILISRQYQGRPFDYYYVKFFKDILLFLCHSKGVCHENPPPNENPPIPSVLPNQSVSYTQVKVHTVHGYTNQLKIP